MCCFNVVKEKLKWELNYRKKTLILIAGEMISLKRPSLHCNVEDDNCNDFEKDITIITIIILMMMTVMMMMMVVVKKRSYSDSRRYRGRIHRYIIGPCFLIC